MSDLLARLIAAGTPLDLVGEVAQAIADAAAGARPVSAGAARTRRWRERKASQSVTEASPGDASPTVTNRHQPSHGDAPRVGARAEPKITNSSGPSEKQGKEDSSLRSQERTPKDELLSVLDEEHADAVIEHRKRVKPILSTYAAKLLARKFAQVSDPNAAADAMIANGWKGFEPHYLERRQQGPPRQRGPTFADIANGAEAYLRDNPDDEPPDRTFLPAYPH